MSIPAIAAVPILFGSRHEKYFGKEFDKHRLDPLGHGVSARRAIIPIDNDDRVQDGHNVHHERENQILGYERYDHGRGRQNLGHEKQKHNQGEQNRNTQGHLFALVRRQIKDEYAEKADEHRGYDQVDRVEESLAAYAKLIDELHAICLLGVGLEAGHANHVPCARRQVVLQVDEWLVALQLNLLCVEGPRAKTHLAQLLVKWKVAHVDGA